MPILPSDKAMTLSGPDRPLANCVTRNRAGSRAFEFSIRGFAKHVMQKPSNRVEDRIRIPVLYRVLAAENVDHVRKMSTLGTSWHSSSARIVRQVLNW